MDGGEDASPSSSSMPIGRPEWTSQRAFILASVASVVGLGNLWRFPYMAGENGGGTFIVAYVICIFSVGLPLFILETGAGSMLNRGPVGVFRRAAGRLGPALGWSIVLMVVVIMSYYFVVTGWTLGYFVDAVLGNLKPFDEFTSGYASLWWFLAASVLVFIVLRQGTGSVEQLGKVFMPLLMLMVFALALYSQTLSGAAEARAFYTSFDLELFLDPQTWRMAAGQAFYSLGVGTGVLITYGSYIPRNANIVTSCAAVAVTNSAISLCAGIMVFSIIFTFGAAPDSGSNLSFTAFPRIFDDMTGGRLLAPVYFGLLFVAAISSCYSGLLTVTAPLRDELRLSRANCALVTTGAVMALGVPSALSFTPIGLTLGGVPFLEWVDKMSGSGIVVTLGIVGAALIAWRLPRAALAKEIATGIRQAALGRFLPYAAIALGRLMPALALVLLAVTSFL